MNRNNNHKSYLPRTLAWAAFLALICSVQADLKMSAVVRSTGPAIAGVPLSGQYEVDFRGSQARIVQPNGSSTVFDFSASQVSVLNPNTKTYYVEALSTLLEPGPGPKMTANVALDHASAPQTKFGTIARKVTISSQSSGSGSGSTSGNSSAKAPVVNAYNLIKYSGSGWLADGSAVQSSIGSIAPLVLIGAPRALSSSIIQTLDEAGMVPMTLSFDWSTDGQNSLTLSMTVNTIDASTLEDSVFAIPADYKEVQKPISN